MSDESELLARSRRMDAHATQTDRP
jgi:hypothetical protein